MQEPVGDVALGPPVEARTAAQRALVIPLILENVLLRSFIRHEPASVRNIRLVGPIWRDTMDGILLNRVCRDYRGQILKDNISGQSLNAIIETRGGLRSIRSITCYELPGQLSLCTGLTRLDLYLDRLILRKSCATPIILPNLRRLTISLHSSRKALSTLEMENLRMLQTKGSASLHLRLYVEHDDSAPSGCEVLRSIVGCARQSLDILTFVDLSNNGGKQTFEALRELLPALSHLQRVVLDDDLVPSMMRVTDLTLPPLLPYMEVDCTHVSARAVLHKIAELADPSAGASLHPFVLRCYGVPGCKDSRLHEDRAEAARGAITAWKEKRGIEVPEVVAQSWLECESKYW